MNAYRVRVLCLLSISGEKKGTRRVKYRERERERQSWGERKKTPDGFCILLMVARCLNFLYNFFSLSKTSSSLRVFFSDKMYCYLLVYYISRLNSIRMQEIV